MKKFYVKFLTLFFIASFFIQQNSVSQVVINEICPTNINGIINSNGKQDDWVELHNSGSSSVNLSGYGLSDDPTKLFRFTFPSYNLGAGQKILVFASDSTSDVIVDHWEMAVDAQSSWKYKAGSSSLDTNWRNLSFNQSSWSSGNGGIGFGDGDDNTTISVGVSVMMRKTFTIPDTSQILKAVLMMDFDDGFVAYLNGIEIARSNLGTTGVRPAWNDLAFSSHEAVGYQGQQPDSFFISPSILKSAMVNGTNVFAVETHNTTATGSDLSSIPYLFFGMRTSGLTFSTKPSWFHVPVKEYFNAKFKLSRVGETVYLTNPGGTILNQITFPAMEIDNSYCRKPDGSSTWCFVSTPTPDASNNSSICYTGYAAVPVFSKQGGYYNSTQSLTLSTSTPGGVVRYTTNGNVPTTSSPVYSSAISISSSKTVRARVFASGYLPSPVITNTYMINANTKLSTFSITTDSLNLWDYNTGIYVMGPNAESTSPYFGANFWENWSKPATIEYYDRNKNLVSRFDADIEIYGNYSRSKPQKSFEIKLSDKYGVGELNYSLFPDKPFIDEIDNFILRNAGTDWNKVHFRDAYMERLMKGTFSGYLSAEPAIAYLNGEYWGVYHMYENHDQHWIKNNFGFGKSEIDLLIEGGSSMDAKLGSDASFWTLYNYATTQSANSSTYYDYINSNLDLQNYTDYFIAETFYNNGDWIGDWTNNIKLWRPNAPGSKWRYLLYDLDMGFGYSGSVNDNKIKIARDPASFSYSSEMFDAVLDNPTYKKYFINRYCDLLNTIFLPANMDAVMKSYRDTMSYDMTAHFAKWGSNSSTWQSNINSMMSFANARPDKMRDFIKSEFSLGSKVTLTLQTSPAGSGRIEISTITPSSYPWSGIYFKGNPVTITAIPNPGYTFDHWRSNQVISSNNYNQSVTYDFTHTDQITAYFNGSSAPAKISISELNYNSSSTNNAGDWIELHNYGTTSIDITGWKLSDGNDNHNYVFPTGSVIPVNGYLVVTEDSVKFKSQFPSVNNRKGPLGFNFSNAGDQVRLYNHQNSLYLSFFYQEVSPWPSQADGGGYTLELTSDQANPNNGSSWFAGCIGGSPGTAYSPLLSTPVNISGSTTFCSGGSVSLDATYVSGYSYQWKRNGTIIPGANNSVYSATQSGSYTVNISNSGCAAESSPTVVTVVTQQPTPSTTDSSRCGPGVLTLLATSSDTIFWYDAASGGALVGMGDTLVTPMLTQTKTYYARTSRNCASSPVPVNATIIPIAAAPVASDVSRCGPGTVTLTATDTAAMRWYNAPAGGGLLHSGGTFTTGVINNDTSFFVEAGSVCPSPRIEVLVTINSADAPSVLDDSRCGNGTLTLTATSPNPVSWFNNPTGGSSLGSGYSFTTPSLAVTDTFYAEANNGCPSPRVMGVAIVNQVASAPVASDVSICSPGSMTLTATATEQVNWYDAPTGGNLLFTGSNFVTPVLSSSATYFVAAGYHCLSPMVAVQAIISSPPSPPAASNTNRCGPGSVTLIASSPEAIFWYDAPSGGTLLAASDVYVTPSLPVTTPYYAEAGSVCRSSRITVQAIIDQQPNSPVASDVSRCGTGPVTLTASSPQQIYWYSSASGGVPIGTGTTFTTPSLSTTTTYYLETGNTSCRSPRISVQAIVGPPPSGPVVPDNSRCGPGSVTLSASSTGNVSWYSVPSGGTPIGTGLSFSTPSISSTTTYYAEANNGCVSSRTSVQAIVLPATAAPSASNVSNCGNGSITLTASHTEQIYWYTSPTGNSLVATGPTFFTPSLTSTTTFYVEAGNTCRSSRIPVQAIIVQIPAEPTLNNGSRCGPGTVVITASSSATVNWFNAPSGGTSIGSGLTFNTPSISSTTTYYAEASNSGCTSSRVSVQAIIGVPPTIPVTTDASRCGAGAVTLTGSSTATINWYLVPAGGIVVGTGNNFVTPSLNSSTTYYAEAFNGCSSSRVPAQAIINSAPSSPVTNDETRCGPGTLVLNAASTEQIYWYTVSAGGSPVATGASFTTPSLSSSVTYYVEAGDSCRSQRIPVQAFVNPSPVEPVVADVSRCGVGAVDLTAVSAGQVFWFSSSSGGSPVHTGSTFTTPLLNASTTFYAESGPPGCNSSRVAVQAIINSVPSIPSGVNNTRCGPGAVNLFASGSNQLYWFTSSVGGTPIDSGTAITTPSINSTTDYFVANSDGTCESSRTLVQAIIVPFPSPPAVSNVSRCGAGVVTLTASSPQQIFWYDAIAGGNQIGSGSSYVTPFISTNSSYYVETGNICRSARVEVQAIITTNPAPPVLFDSTRCGPGQVVLRAASPDLVNWFDVASGGSAIDTGYYFTTPSINNTTTYYAEAGYGCNSVRIPVIAEVLIQPLPPVVTDDLRCSPGSLTLLASSTENLYWYDAPSGGNLVGTGSTFNTPVISLTTIYYVEAGDDCRSNRVPVNAFIGGGFISTVTHGSNCGPGQVTLSATSLSGGSITWYDSPGGNIIGTGNTFITPLIFSSSTFYVASSSGCPGDADPVNAVIHSAPIVYLGADTIVISGGQTIVLDAGAGFDSYVWSTSETTSDIQVNTPGTYSVIVTDINGCTATDETVVLISTSVDILKGNQKLHVYPNPAHDYMMLNLSDVPFGNLLIKIISVEGKILFSENMKSINRPQSKSISLEGIAAGLYFLELTGEDFNGTVKIIVQ